MSELSFVFRVGQTLDAPRLDNVEGEVKSQLTRLDLAGKIKAGTRSARISAEPVSASASLAEKMFAAPSGGR